jgi:hypothetical protein
MAPIHSFVCRSPAVPMISIWISLTISRVVSYSCFVLGEWSTSCKSYPFIRDSGTVLTIHSGTFASYYTESLFRGDDLMLTNLIGSTQCFVVLFFSFVTGRLLDANYSRQLLLAGSIIITIGMFMLSICNGNGGLNQGNYGLTWLTQGLVVGLGMACFFVSR